MGITVISILIPFKYFIMSGSSGMGRDNILCQFASWDWPDMQFSLWENIPGPKGKGCGTAIAAFFLNKEF